MLFVSYARQDTAAIDDLLTTLRGTSEQVWLDTELSGGEAWWRLILEQVRACDVFVVALSNDSLASKPCQAELRYAQALRKTILPVQIGPVDSLRVTPLATTQIFDFRNPTGDAGNRLAAAVQLRRQNAVPLPSQLPDEPQVPFAYLMRLATTLDGTELTRYQQTELVSELRGRLDEDGSDPAVRRDITRLLCLLHDRPDVTWRTRTEIDNVLVSIGVEPLPAVTNFSTPGTGVPIAPFSGPQPMVMPPFSGPQPMAMPPFSGPQPMVTPQAPRAQPEVVPARDSNVVPRKPRRRRIGWIMAGGIGIAVAAVIVAVSVLKHPAPVPSQSILLSDVEIRTIMGASKMETMEGGEKQDKPSGLVKVLPGQCVGVLYPGLDETYRGSGRNQLAWKVLEEPGGLQRAGVNNNHFIDQDVSTFVPDTGQAVAFVQGSANQWKACSGQTATATYLDHNVYTWTVGDLSGEAPMITQSYTLEGSQGYVCQRVLNAVSNFVIDVKACGDHISDQAGRVADKIAAGVMRAPAF